MTKQTFSLSLLALSSFPIFCAGNTISIIGGNAISDAPGELGRGSFTGNTNVELTFVGSVGGSLHASDLTPEHPALHDLVAGVEEIVDASISREESERVSLAAGAEPRVDIITDIECPSSTSYAEAAGTSCLHFVVEVPMAVTNGPVEYEVKDTLKDRFYEATNLDGRLYEFVKSANAETPFVGIGKQGNGGCLAHAHLVQEGERKGMAEELELSPDDPEVPELSPDDSEDAVLTEELELSPDDPEEVLLTEESILQTQLLSSRDPDSDFLAKELELLPYDPEEALLTEEPELSPDDPEDEDTFLMEEPEPMLPDDPKDALLAEERSLHAPSQLRQVPALLLAQQASVRLEPS